jgi:hypothetical protein
MHPPLTIPRQLMYTVPKHQQRLVNLLTLIRIQTGSRLLRPRQINHRQLREAQFLLQSLAFLLLFDEELDDGVAAGAGFVVNCGLGGATIGDFFEEFYGVFEAGYEDLGGAGQEDAAGWGLAEVDLAQGVAEQVVQGLVVELDAGHLEEEITEVHHGLHLVEDVLETELCQPRLRISTEHPCSQQ